jgi:hypothetical protein
MDEQNQDGGMYQLPTTPDAENTDSSAPESIKWTASEFIATNKSPIWYLALIVISVTVASLVFLLTKDKISTGVIILVAITLGFYAGRKPRELEYELYSRGFSIAGKEYSYRLFRSFAILDEDTLPSIVFVPMQRFGSLLTIYFDPKDEDAIVDLLASHLPLEQRQQDMVDRFMKRIRF